VFLRFSTKHSVAAYACVQLPIFLHVIFVLKHRCLLEEVMQRNIPAASRSLLRVLHTPMWLVLVYTTKLVLYIYINAVKICESFKRISSFFSHM
jgi:hypothetical protein